MFGETHNILNDKKPTHSVFFSRSTLHFSAAKRIPERYDALAHFDVHARSAHPKVRYLQQFVFSYEDVTSGEVSMSDAQRLQVCLESTVQ